MAGTRGARAPTQLLDTTSHDWGGKLLTLPLPKAKGEASLGAGFSKIADWVLLVT